MDDIVLAAEFQRLANVRTQLDHIVLGHAVFVRMIQQRRQQFETHQDIPAYIVLVFYDQMVLVADDMTVALQLRHEYEFIDHIFHYVSVVFREIVFCHTVGHDTSYLIFILRDSYRLKSGLENYTELFPLDDINLTVCTFTYLFLYIP